MLPNGGPGLSVAAGERRTRRARRSPQALAAGELSALYLLHGDPLRDLPDRELVGAGARAARRP